MSSRRRPASAHAAVEEEADGLGGGTALGTQRRKVVTVGHRVPGEVRDAAREIDAVVVLIMAAGHGVPVAAVPVRGIRPPAAEWYEKGHEGPQGDDRHGNTDQCSLDRYLRRRIPHHRHIKILGVSRYSSSASVARAAAPVLLLAALMRLFGSGR